MEVVDNEKARWWARKAITTLRLHLRRLYGVSAAHWIIYRIRNLPRFDEVQLGMYVMSKQNWDMDGGVSGRQWVSVLGGRLWTMVIVSLKMFEPVVPAPLDEWDLCFPFENVWGREMRLEMEKHIVRRRRILKNIELLKI